MRTLRSKILALATVLVVATQAGTIAAVLYTANQEVRERAERNLAGAASVTEQLSAGRGARLRAAGAVLAGDPYFRGAIVGGNLDAAGIILEGQRRRAEVDLAILLDPQGRVLASATELRPARVSFPGLINRADGSATARRIIRDNDRSYEVVTVPIGEDEPIAWLGMGLVLDGDFARRVGNLTRLDATLLARMGSNQMVLGSSLDALDAVTLLDDLDQAGARLGQPLRIQTGGSENVALILPLIPGYGEIELLLSDRLDTVVAPYESLRASVLMLSTGTLALALLGGMVLSRTITDPVQALVQAARRIRDGNYLEPVDVPSGGEVAELASALNGMQEGIADRERRITWQANFDVLTGLPNRLSALNVLEAEVESARQAGSPVSVLLVDLNNVSELGTSLGHDLGDALRCQAAERLRAGLEAGQFLAHLESDQFLILMPGRNAGSARRTADELLHVIGSGLSVRQVNVSVNPRIGIAAFPEHADDAEQLLKRVAIARNEARNHDRATATYEPGNEESHVRQLAILADLRRAARDDEYLLYLQPKISLADGRICGAEALVRWQHPTFGFLSPDQFIPLAEKSGNIGLVTTWALTNAVRECRLWLEEGLDLSVSVNLSGRDLHDRQLPGLVMELLREHDLPARNLVLEITEEAVVRDMERASVVLQCIRELGVRISVDDFGTGYSSLGQIRNLPVDELKIDRSFIRELPDNLDDAAIVRTAIDLASHLDLTVLAEGVESASALVWLQAHGCQQAQGFMISKPMPASEFCAWVRNYDRDECRPSAVLRRAS